MSDEEFTKRIFKMSDEELLSPIPVKENEEKELAIGLSVAADPELVVEDSDVVITGANEVVGGEAEYAINNLLINYNIINEEFLSKREELSKLEKYDEIRKNYLDKLMELFSLNSKTIKEFDQELQELYILDDISLFHVLFKRFKIKEVSINKIVNELNEKLNKKYFNNKVKLDKEYPIQQFSRLFTNIPKENFVIPKFEEKEKIKFNLEYEDKKLDSSCKTCIFNRIYFFMDYLYKKILSMKDKSCL